MEQKKYDLEDRLSARGIEAAGPGFCCETSRGMLWRLRTSGEVAWKTPLPDAPLAGSPVLLGGDLLVTGKSGRLAIIKENTGEVQLGNVVAEPLIGTPQVFGSRVLISGFDGTLHILSAQAPAEAK